MYARSTCGSTSGPGSSRRSFLARALTAGVGLAAGAAGTALTGCGSDNSTPSSSNSDQDILNAAKIAEALAVTMYTGIINNAPFFTRLPADDQGYFQAARQEEMAHYLLLVGATNNQPSPFTTFFFPANMFTSAKTTLDTLVTLEDAFIAAYLVGVRDLSTSSLRLTAARIMGIESDHRTLGRVAAGNVSPQDGGPVETTKGLAGQEESIDPPNNNTYERTYHLASIQDAVNALKPFFSQPDAQAAGFDTTRPFQFQPFTPTAPSPLGDLNG